MEVGLFRLGWNIYFNHGRYMYLVPPCIIGHPAAISDWTFDNRIIRRNFNKW